MIIKNDLDNWIGKNNDEKTIWINWIGKNDDEKTIWINWIGKNDDKKTIWIIGLGKIMMKKRFGLKNTVDTIHELYLHVPTIKILFLGLSSF